MAADLDWNPPALGRTLKMGLSDETKFIRCGIIISDSDKRRRHISKNIFHSGGMAPSEWKRSVRAVRETPLADYSAPGVN